MRYSINQESSINHWKTTIIILLLLIVIIGGIITIWSSKSQLQSPQLQNTIQRKIPIVPTPFPTLTPTSTYQKIIISKSFDETKNIVKANSLGFSFIYPKNWGDALYIEWLRQIRIPAFLPVHKILINIESVKKYDIPTTTMPAIARIIQDEGCKIDIHTYRMINDLKRSTDNINIVFIYFEPDNLPTEKQCNELWDSLPQERIYTKTYMPHSLKLIDLRDEEIPIQLQKEYQQFKEILMSFKSL